MRRVGIRRAKKKVRRRASSIFVAAKVATLADSTPRYRFSKDSIFPSHEPGEKNEVTSRKAHAHFYWAAACSTVASIANRLQEPACEFGNSIWLAPSDGLSRNQLSPNAQRDRPGGDEAECSPLIHAAGGNHRNVGKHRLKILEVAVASDVPAGHNLDEIWAQFPRGDDAGWSECPGNHNHILLHSKLYRLWIKAVARKELSPCIQTAACGLDIVHASGAHNHVGGVLHDMRNYFDRFGHGQRNFENGNSPARHRLGRKQRILHGRHPNGRNDP